MIYWILKFFYILAHVVLEVVIFFLIWQMRKGGGYFVPTSKKNTQAMIELAEIRAEDVVVDLGSGNGRLVFAAAEKKLKKAIGYEIDPVLYKISQGRAKESGFGNKVEFRKQSFWDADLSEASVVFIFQLWQTMPGLAKKLKQELKPGARVLCNGLKLPGWDVERKIGPIYLYKIKQAA